MFFFPFSDSDDNDCKRFSIPSLFIPLILEGFQAVAGAYLGLHPRQVPGPSKGQGQTGQTTTHGHIHQGQCRGSLPDNVAVV